MKRREFLNASFVSVAAGYMAANARADTSPDNTPPDNTPPAEAAPFEKIKIVQIGVRHEHASGKINSLKMLPEYFEILGVAAESPEEEKKHKNDVCYRDLAWYGRDEILDLSGVEAVAVETEMTELLPTATKCAEHGFHLHVDKPLGQNLDECRQFFDVCRKNNVFMQPGYMFRSNQAFRLAIQAVRENWLGDILDVTANMDRTDTDPAFRKWLAGYRGGGMYDFGSHLVDFVVEMLGSPNEIHVIERPSLDDGLSDNTLALMLYNRAIVQLRVNERSPVGNRRRLMTIVGTKGRFELDPLENWGRASDGKLPPLGVTLTLDEDHLEYQKGTHRVEIPPFNDRYVGQLTDFAYYLRGGKQNPYTFEHELLVQEAILAASGYMEWKKR